MIQNYSEMKFRVENLSEYLKDSSEGLHSYPIQKIFSDSKYISFAVRLPGQTLYLQLGRGSNHEGLWVTSKNIPAQFRVRDRYLEYLRKYLVGARIKDISLDLNDRIIFFEYYKKKALCLFSLFYCGRNLYFINIYKKDSGEYAIFLSWEHVRDNHIDVVNSHDMKSTSVKFFDTIGRLQIKKIAKATSGENLITGDGFFKQLYETILLKSKPKTFSKRKKKFYQKKEVRITSDLKKVKIWKELKQLIEMTDFTLPEEYQFKLLDINFKIQSDWNRHKRMNEVYLKIKKLKKAEEILTQRLKQTKADCKGWVEGHTEIEYKHDKILCPVWYGKIHQKSRQKIESTIKYNIKEYVTMDNIKLIVGSDASANDYIRSKHAHKDDMWFHLEGMKSAHLIAKIKSFSDILPEHFTLFASIIRDTTHLDIVELPLVYTNVKNIKGLKGQKGSVTLKKQKYLVTFYDKIWKEKISEL